MFIAVCRRIFCGEQPRTAHAYAVKPFRKRVRPDLLAPEGPKALNAGAHLVLAAVRDLVHRGGRSAWCRVYSGMPKRERRANKPTEPDRHPDQQRHIEPD